MAATGVFKRLGAAGREIWIEASYNLIFAADGAVEKIVKVALDVTERHRQSADALGQIEAISRSQAVIEFDIGGVIRTANRNFLDAVGYTLDEIRGRRHQIVVDPVEAASPDHQKF